MYKLTRIVAIVLVLALVLAFGRAAFAQGPAGPWASGIACVNLDTVNAASITISFYPEGSGTATLTYPDTIPAGGSKTYFTPSSPPGLSPGFMGSAVVSSTTPVACNVNTQKQSSGTVADPYRIGTSAGISSEGAGATVYAPQVMRNLSGWSSYMAVQNTSTAQVTVNVTYRDAAGNHVAAADESTSIPAQSSKVFYQAANPGLPDNFIGAATVVATGGELAAVVNFYNSGVGFDTSQLHSYNGFTGGANNLFVPRIVRNFYGYNGGLSIQNIGGASTTIRITFNFAGNTYVYNSGTIAPGAALPLYAPNIPAIAPVDALPVGQRFGSAVIEVLTGGPIVAIVNEDNRGGPDVPAERVGQGSSYNAIANGTQSGTMFFAQVPRHAGGIFSGGFQIANTTGTAATCNIVYVADMDANETGVSLPANGSIARYAPNVPNLDDGYNAAVRVTCTQPIVGISNLAVNPGSLRYGDSFTQANGLNQ
jgi:hypothetical protein